jgi:hypothetical protein
MCARRTANFAQGVYACRCAGRLVTAVIRLLQMNPHKHVLRTFGICVDAPDGLVRIVMDVCEEGSLFVITHRAQPGVRAVVTLCHFPSCPTAAVLCCPGPPHRAVSLIVVVDAECARCDLRLQGGVPLDALLTIILQVCTCMHEEV